MFTVPSVSYAARGRKLVIRLIYPVSCALHCDVCTHAGMYLPGCMYYIVVVVGGIYLLFSSSYAFIIQVCYIHNTLLTMHQFNNLIIFNAM